MRSRSRWKSVRGAEGGSGTRRGARPGAAAQGARAVKLVLSAIDRLDIALFARRPYLGLQRFLTAPALRRKRLRARAMNEAVSPTLEGVTISASAARRLNTILKGDQSAALRISVKGGGCSGFQYSFDVDRSRAEDDVAVTRDGATLLVDPVSLEMLKGAELDFVDDLMGQSFRVKNPNAVASCGCGVSFTV